MNKQIAISLICNFIVSLKWYSYCIELRQSPKLNPNQECIAIGSLAQGLIEEVISCNFLTKYQFLTAFTVK